MDRTQQIKDVHSHQLNMAIDKNKIEKAIKVINFVKDIKGKFKRKTNFSGLHAHVRGIVDNGTVRTEM